MGILSGLQAKPILGLHHVSLLMLLFLSTFTNMSIAQAPTGTTTGDAFLPTDLSSTTPSMPQFTDDASDGDDDGGPTDNGVVNYYFLLLAIFVILVAVSYCFLARRRRRRMVMLSTNRQNALQRDLEGWHGTRYWGHGRWGTPAAHDTRPEEGLDERGLAPPPYIPAAPKPVYAGSGPNEESAERAIPLQNLHNNDEKPPDYMQRSVDLGDSVPRATTSTEGGR